jgi:hypothetical protein
MFVSIVALAATLANCRSQNSQWGASNQPHFTLSTTPYFTAFEELDASAVESRNWVYSPWFTIVQNSGVRTSKVHRYSELVWFSRYSPSRPAFPDTLAAAEAGTVKEAENEITRRALSALKEKTSVQ